MAPSDHAEMQVRKSLAEKLQSTRERLEKVKDKPTCADKVPKLQARIERLSAKLAARSQA